MSALAMNNLSSIQYNNDEQRGLSRFRSITREFYEYFELTSEDFHDINLDIQMTVFGWFGQKIIGKIASKYFVPFIGGVAATILFGLMWVMFNIWYLVIFPFWAIFRIFPQCIPTAFWLSLIIIFGGAAQYHSSESGAKAIKNRICFQRYAERTLDQCMKVSHVSFTLEEQISLLRAEISNLEELKKQYVPLERSLKVLMSEKSQLIDIVKDANQKDSPFLSFKDWAAEIQILFAGVLLQIACNSWVSRSPTKRRRRATNR